MSKKVVTLNFSGRKDGNCAEIGRFIAQYHANSNILAYNVGENWTPCGSCNYECLKPGEACPALNDRQRQIMDKVLNADMVYYIVPNYCGFPSANFYAFNERSVGYFNMDRTLLKQYMDIPKKFIIISNTENPAFLQAMQQQAKDPDMLFLKTSAYQKKSTAGDLMTSEKAQKDLKAFLDSNPV